jgi:hypothetical protein
MIDPGYVSQGTYYLLIYAYGRHQAQHQGLKPKAFVIHPELMTNLLECKQYREENLFMNRLDVDEKYTVYGIPIRVQADAEYPYLINHQNLVEYV